MKKLLLLTVTLTSLILVMSSCLKEGDTTKGVNYLAVKIAGQNNWSIIDINTGKFLYENEFKNKPTVIVDNRFFVEKDLNNGYECYDVNDISKALNSEAFVTATYFSDGVAAVTRKDDPASVIDINGQEVKTLDKRVKMVLPYENGFAIIQTEEDKCGFINTRGETVIKAEYDGVINYSADGYAVVCKQMNDSMYHYSIVDTLGQKTFSFTSEKYMPIGGLVNGVMPVKKGDKVVYIDKEGNRVLDAQSYQVLNGVYGMYDGVTAYASEDGRFGVMSKDGTKLIRDKYDLLLPLKDGTFMAQRDGKVGVIDRNDNVLIGFEYLRIEKLKDNRYLVKIAENNYSIIDGKNNEICKETLSDVSYSFNEEAAFSDAKTKVKEFTELENLIEKLSEEADSAIEEAAQALIEDNELETEDGQEQMNESHLPDYVVVNGVNVRLRSSPALNNNNIYKDASGKNLHPEKGETLRCVDEYGDFYKVIFQGQEVWISKQFAKPY